MEITKEHIGQELYPVDNSYSQDLSNGEPVSINNGYGLAGGWKQPAVKVKIVTGPISLRIYSSILGKELVHDMVIVEYQGKKYLVLNNFVKVPDPFESLWFED